MITRVYVASLLLVGAISATTPSDAHAQDRPGVARPISAFGLDVFRHVASAESGPNVVFSPLSAGLAIALLAEGSEEETRAELHTALGTTLERSQEYRTGIRTLLTDLNADTTTLTRIASSLWADEGRRLSRAFVERAQTSHLASVESVDLQADATVKRVNDWAREKTNGRITSVMPQPRPDLALILLNAVYFKGKWALPFDSTKTKLAPFLRRAGDTIQVQTMVRGGDFGHFEHNGERGLRIPYRGGRYAAYVVVPKSVSVQSVVAQLTVSHVDGWSTSARARSTILYLPRIEHRGSSPLLEALAKAGVPRVVSKHAQLGAIWEELQEGPTNVSEASQATFLKIDEDGTEAAAVTSMGFVVTSAPPPPVDFRVDAPFVFVIRDEVTGALMFVARLGDPLNRGAAS